MAVITLCVIALLACTLCLGGCKESDAIVERIYDQNSSNIDYDNPDKRYIPDEAAAPITREQQQAIQESDVMEDVIERDLPDSVGNEDTTAARTTEFRPQGESRSKAPQSHQADGRKRKDAGGTSSEDDEQKPSEADDGGEEQGGEEGPSDQDPGTDEGIKPADPDDDTYLDRVHDSTYGDIDDLPTDVNTVAAIGELATIVQIVGDRGMLVGSSEEYLQREPIRTVFAGKGVQDVPALWSGDGATTTEEDAKAIIRANPDACIVYSGQLNANLERLILQNRPEMRIITLPKPTSAKNIAVEFRSIGRMLSQATDDASTQRAQEYLDFNDRIVAEAESAHGGGVSTYASIDYNNNDSTQLLTVSNPSSQNKWTLYISGWDDDAAVTARYESSILFEDTGAAYTNTGWSWSPLSYYMSVGGAINNAAAYGPLSTQLIQPVLTLNQNQVSYVWKDFCVAVDESRGGGGFSRYRAFFTLTNGRDAVDRGGINPDDLHQLGSDDFDTVIVKTRRIANALTQACSKENGLYTLYDYETTLSGSGYGRKYLGRRGESIVYSTVKGDVGFKTLVNPCGYVGSWTDGSIEAPLEALWIANKFWGYDETAMKNRIAEFYSTFYDGYEPNVDKILDGSYATED